MKNYMDIFDEVTADDIYDKSIKNSELYEFENDDQSWVVVGRNKHLSASLKAAEHFTQNVLLDPDIKFQLQRVGKRLIIEPAAWARQLAFIPSVRAIDNPNYQLSENLKLLRNAMGDLPRDVFMYPERSTYCPDKGNWEVLNEVIQQIRTVAKSQEFKNVVERRSTRAKRNYISAKLYIDNRFDWYSRLLVLRVDLGYRFVNDLPAVNAVQAKQDWQRLMNNKRGNPGLFKTWVGQIARLEYGADKGFHFHVTLFLNGADSEKDEYLAQVIGRYWVDVITKGRGLFFNCNRKKAEYRYCGIGMVSHGDEQKREFLLRAVAYLAKKDQFLRVAPEHGRVFLRGEIVTVPEVRCGRRRRCH